ncbi:MAG TPA: peptidylprolyl isomerase [Candidatus Nanoarchaeia archaeon]|nr:peptidylprolyl isomerase [Candidatus Nanoarchaeia archaeon]
MVLKEKDFIEIEFTGKIKNGDIFDSNIKSDIEKANLKTTAKPFIFSLGQGMFLRGIDDFLIGKEIGKQYHLELNAEKAFGNRDPKLVQIVPPSVFRQHKLNPFPGAMFNFDGRIAKVLSVSGGRVRVDFNNPLAGKDLEYDLKINRKLEDINEKIKSFIDFLFRKNFRFEIKDKELSIFVEKQLINLVTLFKDKFKDLFNLNLNVIEEKETDKNKSKENKE